MTRYHTRREALVRIAAGIAGAYFLVDGVTRGPVRSFVTGLFLGSAEAVPQSYVPETSAMLETGGSTETPNPVHTAASSPEPTPEVKDMFSYVKEQLAKNIRHLSDYPLALDVAALQVIKQELLGSEITDKRTGQKRSVNILEEYAFPGIEFPVKLQVDRKIDALNGLNLKDKRWEKEALGQVLLPLELMLNGIKTGEWFASGINYQRTREDMVSIGINNVTHSPELNDLSPQEWLREIAVRDYQDKGSRGYEMALKYSLAPTANSEKTWPNSVKLYMAKRKEMLEAGDDLPIFIKGYPLSLRKNGAITYEPGYDTVPYAVLVGRSFGRPVFSVNANYTRARDEISGRPDKHSDAYVLTEDGGFFGLWLDRKTFLEDFKSGINPPGIDSDFNTNELSGTSFKPFEV